jgi:hypothetical protein
MRRPISNRYASRFWYGLEGFFNGGASDLVRSVRIPTAGIHHIINPADLISATVRTGRSNATDKNISRTY